MKNILVSLAVTSFAIIPSTVFAEDCAEAARVRRDGLAQSIQSESAVSAFRKAVKLCAGMATAHYDLGRALLATGDREGAVRSFREAVGIEPTNSSRVGLGNALLETDELDGAEREFRTVFEGDPREIRAMQGLSAVLIRKKRFEEAEELLRQAIQLDPGSARLFYNQGVMLSELSRNDEAVLSLEAAVEKDGTLAPAWILLARLRERLGRGEDAVRAYRRATLLQPKDVALWRALASLQQTLGDYSDALDSLEKGAQVVGGSGELTVDSAVVLFRLGKVEEAVTKLRSIPVDSGEAALRARAQSVLGWIYLQQKELEAAENALRASVQLNPDDPFAQNNLGVLLDVRGQKAEAEQAFRRAKELDPNLESAQRNLAELES